MLDMVKNVLGYIFLKLKVEGKKNNIQLFINHCRKKIGTYKFIVANLAFLPAANFDTLVRQSKNIQYFYAYLWLLYLLDTQKNISWIS